MEGHKDFRKEELFFALLEQLLEEYAEPFVRPAPEAEEAEIQKICAYLDANYAERISLDDLCRLSGLDKYYLLRAFTRYCGITPYRYLETVRVARAKSMLEEGSPPLETALRAGFADQSHFTKFFKSFIGLTPDSTSASLSKSNGEIMTEQKNLIGHLAALMTIVIWGTTFISTKVLLRDFTPVEILFFRFSLGFIALFLAYPRRLRLPDQATGMAVCLRGALRRDLVLSLGKYRFDLYVCLQCGRACGGLSLFTALLSFRFLDAERPSANFFLGFAVAIAGIALISFNGGSCAAIEFPWAICWPCWRP